MNDKEFFAFHLQTWLLKNKNVSENRAVHVLCSLHNVDPSCLQCCFVSNDKYANKVIEYGEWATYQDRTQPKWLKLYPIGEK